VKPVYYLAGPYTHPEEKVRRKRAYDLSKAAFNLIMAGYCIYSPISETVSIADSSGHTDTGWGFWREQDLPKLELCSELWILTLDGWKASKGVRGEIKYSLLQGKPIALVNPDTLKLTYVSDEDLFILLDVQEVGELND
jgi:hypothetical protein